MKEVKVRHSKLENTTFRKVSLIVMILVAITCLLPFVLCGQSLSLGLGQGWV